MNLSIRKATPDDAGDLAHCLLLAMEDIVLALTGSDSLLRARSFLRHFAERENNQYSWQNCWVALRGPKVVAAANLYEGSRLHELRQPVLDYLRIAYGRELQPEDETGPGERYLDSTGVLREEQRGGIG